MTHTPSLDFTRFPPALLVLLKFEACSPTWAVSFSGVHLSSCLKNSLISIFQWCCPHLTWSDLHWYAAFRHLHVFISFLCCLVTKSCLTLFGTPWTVACQAPLSRGFPRQEYCHFILQGIFLTQRSNPCLLYWQVDSLPLSHREAFSFLNWLL